ncbi:hypothetical protein Kpol_1036p84 [Vanderwaltozyma polyspora DSM 70294]|uniref:Uncharacterized protein n=1 Tax=Vanderwaltozyma polyspora (strain ATCC 22028 / DSM 70294 / BCRC 21397 / CBS 2163 / NBRC 10782 / NRRL Y-8283 / UCD 57-17) TaxID=436907 RepID=A7TEN0_VANPO|nr:uncharacterized protein Kpol_1036p84 [Vanderwaltozyma polyspora DSM 70294]EDO19337.1 hypothetical protein Kpol_1036p84 [Vanderwaltozyma polyspora DSM 70294]
MLDEWCVRLPFKSKHEIYSYYQILKKNLNILKSSKMKKHGGIMSRIELPIAYEMDEYFIDLEEHMSERVRNEFEQAKYNEPDDNDLISIENWEKRWLTMYSRTHIEELQPPCKLALPISDEAYDYLKNCCYKYLEKLLNVTILMVMNKRSIPKDETGNLVKNKDLNLDEDENGDMVITYNDSKSDKYLPHVIKKDDVNKSILLLKQEYQNIPTFGESILSTLRKFQIQYELKGKLFKTNEIARSMIPALIFNTLASNTIAEPEQEFEQPINIPKQQQQQQQQQVYHHPLIKRLYKLNNQMTKAVKRSRDNEQIEQNEQNEPDYQDYDTETSLPPFKKQIIENFIADDSFNRINNPLEFEICDWETNLMEQSDMNKSAMYQHAILNYLSTDDTDNSELITITNDIDKTSLECPLPITKLMSRQFLFDNS